MCLYSLYAGTANPLKLSHYTVQSAPVPRGSFLVYSKENRSKKILHSSCPHFPQCSVVLCGHHNNYLWTYDLYGPAHKDFDAGGWITW